MGIDVVPATPRRWSIGPSSNDGSLRRQSAAARAPRARVGRVAPIAGHEPLGRRLPHLGVEIDRTLGGEIGQELDSMAPFVETHQLAAASVRLGRERLHAQAGRTRILRPLFRATNTN